MPALFIRSQFTFDKLEPWLRKHVVFDKEILRIEAGESIALPLHLPGSPAQHLPGCERRGLEITHQNLKPRRNFPRNGLFGSLVTGPSLDCSSAPVLSFLLR